MKNILLFLTNLILTCGLVYVLSNSFEVGGNMTPPLGNLINPFSGFWQNAEPSVNLPAPDLQLKGLSGKAEIIYDDRMVPHIFAANIIDAAYVQGYITARDRLFQMDFSTRATAGRVSEIVGEKAIQYDLMQRRRGLVFAAENAVKGWKKYPESYKALEAYVNGVNAWIEQLRPKDYPIEYKIMNFAPEKWSVLKTAIFVKSMCQSLNFGEDDVETTNALSLFGKEVFDFLYPETFWEQSPVIPENVSWNFKPSSASNIPSFPDFGQPLPVPVKPEIDRNNGSNNWAVAPSKTLNKKPILCGDPHLPLRLPSIWYELQIVVPEFNTYGVSIPGIPGILIGFNENIAWTQTNVGHDVLDWYTLNWKDNSKMEYEMDGQWIKATIRLDTFYIKGKKVPLIDTVRYTAWGPVAFEADSSIYKDMAMRWLAHDIPRTDEIGVFYDLMSAKNYDEYATALQGYVSPAQNYAFACKDGDIALRVQGQFPIKSKSQGRFVQDGSKSANAWHGWIPEAQKPFVRNPARGFISSANQQSTSQAYPYYYNSEMFEPYRGRILNQKLTEMDSLTMDDMKVLQNLNYGLNAAESLPLMLALLDTAALSVAEKQLLAELRGWNYNYDKSKTAPVIFEKWFDGFYVGVWDEISGTKNAASTQMPAAWRTVFLLRDDPGNRFFDKISTPVAETAGQILTEAFHTMAIDYAATLLTNPTLDWSSYRNTKISHLARLNAFSSTNINTGGYKKSLNAMTPTNGPSWRMIVELGDTPKAQVVYPGGQSGNPGSKYYDNFITQWANGEYYEALYLKTPDQQSNKIVSRVSVSAK